MTGTAAPAALLATCQAGFEDLLARELAAAGRTAPERGLGWVRAAPGGPAPDLAFAHLLLLDPVEIRGRTVNALARAALAAFGAALRGERIEAEWPEAWSHPPEPSGLGERTAAVAEAFAAALRRKLPRVARLARSELPRSFGPARGLFVHLADFDRGWLARAAWVNGPRRMADDPAAPSRSYLKLEEALLLLGCEPAAGDSVVDLGAAPGGWSYGAARRGARVVAVDNGPLKGGARDHPGIEHRRADAFGYRPPSPCDWLLCDLVEDPQRVLRGLVRPWLEHRWCRRFVVNLKFGRVDPLALLRDLRSPGSPLALAAGARIRHLYHDRKEFTVVGTV